VLETLIITLLQILLNINKKNFGKDTVPVITIMQLKEAGFFDV